MAPKSIVFAALLAILFFIPGGWAVLSQSVSEGEAIFQDQCSGCHTIGGGDLIGPDLMGVVAKRDPQWLTNFILAPDKVLASGDALAADLLQQYGGVPMPNLNLNPDRAAAVIEYLRTQSGDMKAPPLSQAAPPPGDAARGETLFMGNSHFENDGPPCMGCHNIGDYGLLGGGSLGPDLTKAADRFTDSSMAAALANLPWPTMKPVYAEHPLNPQEQADLRAFIFASIGKEEINKEFIVLGLSLAGSIGAVGVVGFFYRNRNKGVRKGLLRRVRSGR